MILLTGGSGFLGKAISEELPTAKALSSYDLDLTNHEDVMDAFSMWRPEVVVHCAARVGGITENMSRPADFLIDNMRMDANLFSALRAFPPQHFIPMLSTCMYPDRLADDQYPMTEEMIEAGPPPPTNAAYAAGKRALWRGTLALHQQYGIPFTALVPTNLYGPGDHFGEDKSHFLASAIDKIEKARLADEPEVSFFGTGTALRQYVLVTDLARLVAHLVVRGPVNETLNVVSDGGQSIGKLARVVSWAVGFGGKVVFTGEGPDGQHRKDVTAERLRKRVPEWRDMETSLWDGLVSTINWYRANVESR